MNLPTAHSYIIQNLIESLISLEENFLKPSIVLKLLNKIELAMGEIVGMLNKKELTQEVLEKEKDNIKLIIEQLGRLEKTSHEKLNWATQFSNYLQKSINTK